MIIMIKKDKLILIDKKEFDNFVDRLKKIKWVYWLNRPYSVFMATIFWEGVREAVFERTGFGGVGPDNHLYQFPDIYYDEEYQEKGLRFFDKYFKTHKMSDLSESLEVLHKDHIARLRKIINNKVSIPEKTADISLLIQDYIPYLWIVTHLEEHFNKAISVEVPKYIQGDYHKFVGDISIPTKKNVYVLMLEEIKSGKSIKEIKDKYGWMKSRDGFTDFYTEKEIEEIKNGIKDNEKHIVNIPKELIFLAEELKELNYFRTSRTDKFYEFFGVARPLMEQIAKHVGIDFKELANYDANSIINGQPREYNKDFSYGLVGNEYYISNIKMIDFSTHDSIEISGRVAFKGLVTGIVKIVTHPNDVAKVNSGDILVAQMTFPSFISAMQKASAFVTDEGSITCHAAIVAREMKKPCIVGTKNATKVLKDGDLVEVYANNCVVKILK